MKITLREQIIHRFKRNYQDGKTGFVNSQSIQDVMHPITGRKHETIARELRRMAVDGILEKDEIKLPTSKVASVYYKYKPSDYDELIRIRNQQY